MKDKKLMIFDFDGTIADTVEIHDRAFQKTLEPFSMSFRYRDHLGKSTREVIEDVFRRNKRELESEMLSTLTERKKKFAEESYAEAIHPIPGALSFIERAAKKGLLMSIASSGSRKNISTALQILGIGSYFNFVITSDDVVHSKPDPEILLNALHRNQLLPEQALVIEDSLAGLNAALAAKIEAVCIDPSVELKDFPKDSKVSRMTYSELTRALEDMA